MLEALKKAKPLQRVLFLKGKQTDEMSDILGSAALWTFLHKPCPKNAWTV